MQHPTNQILVDRHALQLESSDSVAGPSPTAGGRSQGQYRALYGSSELGIHRAAPEPSNSPARGAVGRGPAALRALIPGKGTPTLRRLRPFLILFAVATLLTACGQNFGWYVVDPTLKGGRTNLWFMITGFQYTILLSLISLAISIPIGLAIGLCGLSSNPLIKGFNRGYVEIIRAIPLLVLVLWVYYGLPEFDIRLDVFWSGVIGLAIGESAFQAEIFRGGIQSVPKGQIEAAKAISLSRTDTMRYVILPQAIKRILPAMGNQFIYVVKMSSLVSVIGAPELTRKAGELIVTEYRALEIYTILALEYLALVLLLSAGVRWLERKMGADERK